MVDLLCLISLFVVTNLLVLLIPERLLAILDRVHRKPRWGSSRTQKLALQRCLFSGDMADAICRVAFSNCAMSGWLHKKRKPRRVAATKDTDTWSKVRPRAAGKTHGCRCRSQTGAQAQQPWPGQRLNLGAQVHENNNFLGL